MFFHNVRVVLGQIGDVVGGQIAGLQGHHEVDVHLVIGIDSFMWQSSVNWLPTFEPCLLGNILKRQFDHIGLQSFEDRAGSFQGCPNDAVVLAAID